MTPNAWDMVVLMIVFGLLAILSWGTSQMATPYQIGEVIEISLDPRMLPQYSIHTVLRMFIAMFFSLLFTFCVAPLAAKNKHAEKFLIPFIDVMQSIPVLGMLSITVVGFIKIFPNSQLGPECAAIFAIFTSQVWNMALSFYQSLRTVPHDLIETSTMYHLSPWQRFWKIEVPHGTPPLLWNTMVSMSAGWFFVVLSEAIEVSKQKISLPGIGSYIDLAIQQSDLKALFYAIIAMFLVILLYDQLLFRPLLTWVQKYDAEIDEEMSKHRESWFFDLLTKTRLLKKIELIFEFFADKFINYFAQNSKDIVIKEHNVHKKSSTFFLISWYILIIAAVIIGSYFLVGFINDSVSVKEIIRVFGLGGVTALKVIFLIVLASIIWIPIGVWIGSNPKLTAIMQPLIQFLAAFPANLFYPLVVLFIVRYDLNHNIWTMPLMILGTQWYILFNTISGTASIPKEIRLAVKNFGVKGTLWWRKMILPAIFPHYVTGAMAAAGGCWNASIVAEYVEWGENTIISVGLGQYIEEFTRVGDFPRIALGIGVMCVFVMLFNRLLWQKLYRMAEERFAIG